MAKRECEDWLRFSRDDLESAVFLLGLAPRKIEIICYHCQQCAEKALKAISAFFDEEISRSHDLRSLLRAGVRHFPALESLMEVLAELQPYAVAVRYPYEIEVVSGDEERAIENARKTLAKIEGELRLFLASDGRVYSTRSIP